MNSSPASRAIFFFPGVYSLCCLPLPTAGAHQTGQRSDAAGDSDKCSLIGSENFGDVRLWQRTQNRAAATASGRESR